VGYSLLFLLSQVYPGWVIPCYSLSSSLSGWLFPVIPLFLASQGGLFLVYSLFYVSQGGLFPGLYPPWCLPEGLEQEVIPTVVPP